MGDFFAELRRRHIYRIGAVYVVVAWGVIQVLDVLSQLFALPDWIAQPAVIVLAIGFPVVLIAAWLIEGKAHEAVASAVRSKATTVDWILAAALVAVLAVVGYQQFAPSDVSVARSGVLPNSVAILLFDNLSPNPDDAYFAAGVHESILNELAKIRDMNVIARTSVLRYADADMSIPDIANELNVETVMEGSVRYAGDQVRVTAQLIDPSTGAHIWSEEYDRDLADIFAIQSDIATRIAAALEAEILPSELESIERPPTNSPDAYAAFLRAMAVVRDGFRVEASPGARSIIQGYLDEALRLDAEFALAHAWKARIYMESRNYDPVTEENWPDFRSEMEQLALAHADMALALDPSEGFAHAVLARLHWSNWRAGPAQMEAEQALRLSPNDPDVIHQYAEIENYVGGRHEEATENMRRAVELDPNYTGRRLQLGESLLYAGRYNEARDALQECLTIDPAYMVCALFLSSSEFGGGNDEAALDALRITEQLMPADAPPPPRAGMAYGYGLLGQGQDAVRSFEIITELAAGRYVDPVTWARAHLGVGDYDEALRQLTIAAENHELVQDPYPASFVALNMWSDPALEEPAFVEVRERLRVR
jgi:TolB-like protein